VFLEHTLIPQSKISREIDGFNGSGQAWNDLHRLPVREREENTVNTGYIFRRINKFELRQAVQVSMDLADRFSGLLIRGYEHKLDVWMEQQNTQQLRAAVPGATEYSYANLGFHLLQNDLAADLKDKRGSEKISSSDSRSSAFIRG
jgi:hypothetical protein